MENNRLVAFIYKILKISSHDRLPFKARRVVFVKRKSWWRWQTV